MMAGTQQSVELKLALDQEQQKSKKLEDSMKKLDDEMQRTDELLYQMIPKSVADRLRKGENPVDTCQVLSFSNNKKIDNNDFESWLVPFIFRNWQLQFHLPVYYKFPTHSFMNVKSIDQSNWNR